MKRIHANQAEAIANSLSSILEDKQRASRVLQACVEAHPKWGSRDRNLLYTATYSILRWKQLYSFYAGITTNRFSPWSWIKTWCILYNIEIPEWKELHCPPYETKSSLEEKELPSNSLKHAFPDWIYQLGHSEYGESWEKECRSLNTQADISLRVNRLLTNPEKVQRDLLEKYQIESELMRDYPDALQL
jgi:16S rRNA (cytosine967-C5)-methyltransferase